jgi:hypothetical protein
MPDTARTYAALQALLADNTTGDISPQDLRDVLKTLEQILRALAPDTGATETIRLTGNVAGPTLELRTAHASGILFCAQGPGGYKVEINGSGHTTFTGSAGFWAPVGPRQHMFWIRPDVELGMALMPSAVVGAMIAEMYDVNEVARAQILGNGEYRYLTAGAGPRIIDRDGTLREWRLVADNGVVGLELVAGGGGGGEGETPADIAPLVTTLGGDANVLYFGDVRYGVTESAGRVSAWADVRDASPFALVNAASESQPAWVDVGGTDVVRFAAGEFLTFAAAAVHPNLVRTIAYGGTLTPAAEDGTLYAMVVAESDTNDWWGLACRMIGGTTEHVQGRLFAAGGGNTDAFADATGGVGYDAAQRRAIVSRWDPAGPTLGCQVMDHAEGTGAPSTPPGGATGSLTLGTRWAGFGATGDCRYLIVLATPATPLQADAIADWAEANHGITRVA